MTITDVALHGHKSRTKSAIAPVQERVAAFAAKHKLKSDTTIVLGLIVENYERTNQPLVIDGFELAAKAGVTHKRAHEIRDKLVSGGAVRVRSGNAFGIDGLVPGDAWGRQ